jgi:hypothetical protein
MSQTGERGLLAWKGKPSMDTKVTQKQLEIKHAGLAIEC